MSSSIRVATWLELMRDALITGLKSQVTRQKLLEKNALIFEDAFRKACAMDRPYERGVQKEHCS